MNISTLILLVPDRFFPFRFFPLFAFDFSSFLLFEEFLYFHDATSCKKLKNLKVLSGICHSRVFSLHSGKLADIELFSVFEEWQRKDTYSEICWKITVKRLDLTFLWYIYNISVSFIKIYSYLNFSVIPWWYPFFNPWKLFVSCKLNILNLRLLGLCLILSLPVVLWKCFIRW